MNKTPLYNQPWAHYSTLKVGGNIPEIWDFTSSDDVFDWLQIGLTQPYYIAGGGSNILVSDTGFQGCFLRFTGDKIEILEESSDAVIVRVEAGKKWDDFVAWSVAENLYGVECLSGIPGTVGAAPIQNIGAYGQEVAQTIVSVEGVELDTGNAFDYSADECDFAYRSSCFKSDQKGLRLITAVLFRLAKQEPASYRHQDLASLVKQGGSLAQVRELVLEIRGQKSMVYNEDNPSSHSLGSFFLNPHLTDEQIELVHNVIQKMGSSRTVPQFPSPQGVKVPAAFLIEMAGFYKGLRFQGAGLSQDHVLAIVNYGEARTEDIVGLAAIIRRRVYEVFQVYLHPEPNFVGFSEPVEVLLDKVGSTFSTQEIEELLEPCTT